MSIASAAHAAGTDWVAVLIGYWWLWLLIGSAVLEWIGETFDIGLSALRRRSKVRHKRRMELRRMDLEIAQARAGAAVSPSSPLLPRPGPCVHRNVRPVIAADDTLVGWLCACDAQLPPDWAVREEDL